MGLWRQPRRSSPSSPVGGVERTVRLGSNDSGLGGVNVGMARTGLSARMAVASAAVAIAIGAAGCSSPAPRYATADDLTPAPTDAAAQVAATRPANVRWLSGASGDRAADGRFGLWRHTPVDIGGTWDNGDDAQVLLSSICPGGDWQRWTKPLDIAIGAIDQTQGESWAAAARGAYD